jgi:hypothetical protein
MGCQGRPAALKAAVGPHRDHPSHHYADPAAMKAIINSSGINMSMISPIDMPRSASEQPIPSQLWQLSF